MEAVSMRKSVLLAFAVATAGCADRCFTNLGNGTGVPAGTVQRYADQNGVSPQQARQALRAQDDARRVREHAEKYGITLEEADRQIQHDDARRSQDTAK
jgi:hypothetical protein